MPEMNLLYRIQYLMDKKDRILCKDTTMAKELRSFAVDVFYRAVVLKSMVTHPLVKKSADIAIRLAVDIKMFLDANNAETDRRFSIEAGMQQISQLIDIPLVKSSFATNDQIQRFVLES